MYISICLWLQCISKYISWCREQTNHDKFTMLLVMKPDLYSVFLVKPSKALKNNSYFDCALHSFRRGRKAVVGITKKKLLTRSERFIEFPCHFSALETWTMNSHSRAVSEPINFLNIYNNRHEFIIVLHEPTYKLIILENYVSFYVALI